MHENWSTLSNIKKSNRITLFDKMTENIYVTQTDMDK